MNVYLDHAAASPMREEVLSAMLPYLRDGFANPGSLHTFGRQAAKAVLSARDEIAGLLGVNPLEVYFTAGGTEANNWAIRNMGSGKALLSPIEHASVYESAKLRGDGFSFTKIGKEGVLTSKDFLSVDGKFGLFCAMAVNNETGCIQPTKEIAFAAHRRSAFFFTDCVQAACTLDLKQIASYSDGLSLSAHKAGGPKGVGALIVKRQVPLSPLITGGEQERGLRGGTVNTAGVVGFAKALSLAQKEREQFCASVGALRDLFEDIVLHGVEGAKADGEHRAPNLSHITFPKGGSALLAAFDLEGVACSGGAACSSHAARPSHVLLAMGRDEEETMRGVRFSFGRETTREEVLFAAEVVCRVVNRLL